MKKTGSIMVAAVATTAFSFLGSCKKDKQENSITGLWNVRYLGTDDNGNGALEEGEKNYLADTARFTFNFKSGGTGETVLTPSINTGISTTVPFTWTQDGSTVSVTANNETNVVTLLTLDNTTFHGVYGQGTGKTWIYALR